MFSVLIVVHLLITLALIIVVLLQRSEGGGLGIGGGGGMGGLMTTRGTANLLTRVTAVLAATFMAMSLILSVISGSGRQPRAFIEQPEATQPVLPATPSAPAPPLAR